MAKAQTRYVCNSCGAVYTKWQGKCDDCGEWNTIEEDKLAAQATPKGLKLASNTSKIEFHDLKTETLNVDRILSGIGEFDRVLGGGLVPGSAVLIGGDPGIGKSTILLQALAKLAEKNEVSYISGEESVAQVSMRAKRLGYENADIKLAAANSVGRIIASFTKENMPDVLVIDSIQTMFIENIESAPGTVTQVRSCSNELIKFAKTNNIALFIVGHVTKEGTLAGPRVLEHMVDTVLYFEGERGHNFRILRSVKNRFGPADEIGVFEMQGEGLAEVTNPSELFLSERGEEASGSVVFAGIEGSRPVLVEIQALVSDSFMSNPRRAVVGWDSARLAMLLAVLQSRAGISFAEKEVYLNVAGGLKITEPAADLAVVAALLSAQTGKVFPSDKIVFGEVGLSGLVRKVSRADARIKEASKLGFASAMAPKDKNNKGDLQIKEIKNIGDLLEYFAT